MGSSISKQKNKLKYEINKIHLNMDIKKYNKKYGKNITYSNLLQKSKKQKNLGKRILPTHNVRIRFLNSQWEHKQPNIQYSYVYAGTPGGWYLNN